LTHPFGVNPLKLENTKFGVKELEAKVDRVMRTDSADLNHVAVVHECDRQTDGQTDRHTDRQTDR